MPRKHKRNEKITRMFNEQSGVCVYCDECMTLELGHDNTATIDHINPKSLGGRKDSTNEVAACFKCNTIKAAMPISQWLTILMEKRIHEKSAEEHQERIQEECPLFTPTESADTEGSDKGDNQDKQDWGLLRTPYEIDTPDGIVITDGREFWVERNM